MAYKQPSAYIGIFLIAVALSGCELIGLSSDDEGEVIFTTYQDAYAPGDTVMLRLKNNTNETIGGNLCEADLQKQSSDKWIEIGEGRGCLHAVWPLESGKTRTHPLKLLDDLSSGTYRYRFGELATNTFAVRQE